MVITSLCRKATYSLTKERLGDVGESLCFRKETYRKFGDSTHFPVRVGPAPTRSWLVVPMHRVARKQTNTKLVDRPSAHLQALANLSGVSYLEHCRRGSFHNASSFRTVPHHRFRPGSSLTNSPGRFLFATSLQRFESLCSIPNQWQGEIADDFKSFPLAIF